ncbi:MAG: 23S rRNA (pseudouridine(1915)-N(3))-methyltransferase RlmH [Lachnospiraceae bacterium]|nr:23S rRNA (pseudouridine(1915)-N(3))-methyltransferase RlmH [Lachnospiraceae bacterium]
MKIDILCAGKLKEKYLRDAMAEYQKRLSRYCKFNVLEVDDGPDMEHEAERFDRRLSPDSYLIALEIDGEMLSSEELSDRMGSLMSRGISHITFLIGGSDGIDKRISERADMKLSFSKMTFPHQLMRVILIEQIYRSFKIIAKEPYHK